MRARTCVSKGISAKGVLASVLSLLAFVMCMPQLAFADDAFQTIDGTMTITLQNGGASGGGAGGGAGASTAVTTSTTTTSGGASSGVLTGDALIWLILGIVVLIAGAVFIFIKSRRLATNAGAHADLNASSKKSVVIVAIVTALVACACFGMFASKSNAFAKDYLEGITGTSNVVVDDQGNVVSNDLAINNGSGQAIYINNIQAPEELNNWNASIKDETVQTGSSAKGTWDGKIISASLLEQVKNSKSSSIELNLKISINKAFDFDKFTVNTEDATYDGGQITPEVKSNAYKQGTDYEVTYGENKNVGEGTITIKGINDYKGEKTYTFEIKQKELTLIWDGQTPYSFEYDGASHIPSAHVEGVAERDNVNFSVDGAQTNAGIYTATAKIDNANYKLSSEAKTAQEFTITQREVSLTWSGDSFTYSGQAQAPTASAGNIVEGDVVNVTVEGAQINAGTHTATVTKLDNANYKLPDNPTQSFTIAPKQLELTWDGQAPYTYVYDGDSHVPNASISEPIGADVVNLSIDGAQTSASNDAYTATAKIDNANYKLPDNPTQSFTITQREVSLTWSEDALVYNGKDQALIASAGNIVEGDTVNVTVEGAQTNASDSPYTATATKLDNANYKLPANNTKEFTIAKAPVRVSGITAENKPYDGNCEAKLDCSKAVFEDKFEKDSLSISAEGTFKDPNAGTEKEVTISKLALAGDSASNYELATEGQQTTTTATIEQAKLDSTKFTVDAKDVTYNGTQFKPAVTSKTYTEGTDYEVVYGKNINAGEGSVTVKGIGNYTGDTTTKFNIAQADPKPSAPEGITGEVNHPLADIVLPKQTEPVAGTFTWKEPQTNLASEGPYEYIAVFTPKDKNYATVEVAISITVAGEKSAFAVYFKDGSLGFYHRTGQVPSKGDTFDKKKVSEVYTDFETDSYVSSFAPWAGEAIKKVTVVDDGIHPASTARWFVSKETSTLEAIDMEKLDTSRTTDMTSMFENCQNLTSVTGLSEWNTSNVTSLDNFFANCSKLSFVGALSNWNTSKVEKMSGTFNNCSSLSLDCSEWNVDKVGDNHTDFNANATGVLSPWDPKTAYAVYSETDNSLNFYKRVKVPIDGSGFDGKIATAVYTGIEKDAYEATTVPWAQKASSISSSKVVDEGIAPVSTAWWFYDCSSLTSVDVSKLDTSKVTTMMAMFYFTKVTSLDLSNFNTSNVTTMRAMFGDCQNLTTINGLEKWDTGSVTEMAYVFSHCTQLSSVSVSNFNTKNVTTMEGMFDTCSGLTSLDVSNFDTSNVTNMKAMFGHCSSLNTVPVSNFVTKNVTTMEGMFNNCTSLTSLDISSWDVLSNGTLSCTFQNCESLTSLGDLTKWRTSNTIDMSYTFDGCSNLVSDCSDWFIGNVPNDKHPNFNENAPGVKSPWDNPAFAVYSADNNSLRFYKAKDVPTPGEKYVGVTATEVYTGIEEEEYSAATVPWVQHRESIELIDVPSYGIAPKSTSGWFFKCTSAYRCTVDKLDMSNVADASRMFQACSTLSYLDVSNWDTSNVTDMSLMFSGAESLESIIGLKNLNTSKVTNMFGMFADCKAFTSIDVSGFDTSNVTNMGAMFCGDEKLVSFIGLENLDTSKVTSMNEMFKDCSSIRSRTFDVSHFDTSQVTDMSHMFDSCFGEGEYLAHQGTLDLSNWDTSQVTNMSYMFNECKYVYALRLSEKFKTSRVIDMSHMFCNMDVGDTGLDPIEHWDVSNVINMDYTFYAFPNSLDLSGWNVSNVKSHEGFSAMSIWVTDPNWP